MQLSNKHKDTKGNDSNKFNLPEFDEFIFSNPEDSADPYNINGIQQNFPDFHFTADLNDLF